MTTNRTFRVVRAALATALVATLLAAGGPAVGESKAARAKGRVPAWGGLDSPLRPGAQVGSYCTFNFVFYEPGNGSKAPVAYIGTAGHCTDEVGDRVPLGEQGNIGTVVYDSDLVESPVDFSLIKLDRSMVSKTNPAVLGWEGPTGVIDPADLAPGQRVNVYGYGVGVGMNEATRPRFGVLVDSNEDEYLADMPAVNGDSGAPLIHHDTGRALGIISRYGLAAIPPSTDQGPLVAWILREVRSAGFRTLKLATVK